MNFLAAGGKAAIAATLINSGFFIVGDRTGVMLDSVVLPANGKPVTLEAVVTTTLMAVAVAAVVYYLLQRLTKRSKVIFNVLSLALLALSFFTPFSLPSVPLAMALLLNGMHVVVAGCILFFFKTIKS